MALVSRLYMGFEVHFISPHAYDWVRTGTSPGALVNVVYILIHTDRFMKPKTLNARPETWQYPYSPSNFHSSPRELPRSVLFRSANGRCEFAVAGAKAFLCIL